MGTKLQSRVWRFVERANDRVDHDSALLSSVDNHYRIKDTKSKKRLDPKELPVSDFLLFNEDYSGMNFGQLLMHLRPPKITPEQFMDLKYRVEQLGKQPVRETSSNQILSLLEKYHVVVPKEVLESLLNTGIPKGGRRKTMAMTAKQWLAAPKPEAPPDWSLITCKGLHNEIYKSCKIQYQPSLYYKLGRMHHNDAQNAPFLWGPEGSRPVTRQNTAAHIAYARDIAAGSGANVSERSGLTTRLGTAHSRVGTAQSLKSTSAGGMQGSQSRAQTAMSASNDASALPDLPKTRPEGKTFKNRSTPEPDFLHRQRSGDLSALSWTTRKGSDRKAAVEAASGIKSLLRAISRSTVAHNEASMGMSKKPASRALWVEDKPEMPHLCIDTTNNTYTTYASTPRQTQNSVSQKSMHTQRYLLNEIGSKILMA